MDEFFIEMGPFLEDFQSKSNFKNAENSNVLQNYAPNLFAEALIPVNPRHYFVK
jgi:hypothetical protein